jgi:hypothetical protein
MDQADRVYITPPTNTPIDTTRRRFLAVSAGASVASVGALTVAAMPAAETGIPASIDPIYAAIEAHRRANAEADAVFAECTRLHRLATEMVGPYEIEIPSMVEPGTTVMAMCVTDINEAIPRKRFPDLNEHCREQLMKRNAARWAIHGDTDKLTEGPADAAWDAMDEFMETVPTTLPGLLTMVVYAAELFERGEFKDCGELLQSFSTAAEAMIGGRA